MKHLIKKRNFWIILSIDIALLCLAYFLSYFIRFEGKIPPEEISNFKNTVWLNIPFKIFVFFLFNLYRGMWRYTSINDLLNLIKATFVSSTVIILTILYFHRFVGYPRSVFIIDAFLTLVFIGGVRLTIRLAHQATAGDLMEKMHFPYFRNSKQERKRLLVIGAGDAGEKILRELHDNPRLKYEVLGFVDDDPKKYGMQIHGVPVLGKINQLSNLIREHEVNELLIAIASATRKEMRQIVDLCKETGLKYRIIPGMGELIDGKSTVKAIRDVAYEDLMGRETVQLEMEKIGNYIKNKSILVTGAGGSVGSELCRQIAHFFPRNLILLDRTENNLYQIEVELRWEFPYLQCSPILGNVMNRETLTRIFLRYRPDVVFHAAAYKHVPIMELNPWETIFTNIKGTHSLLEVVKEFEVDRFVLVSTDKAVRPSNVMGASKRVAELLTQCYNNSFNPTRFMSVRFGNVIGSSGSVIPLFKRQIERGGPVTVTHPEVTRYFMTIPEAAQLILQAGSMGEGGEIFILDMGSPIKILDLARDLIRLSGFEPDEDIEIKFIGLRPGEKLYEELITEGEGIFPTSHEKIFVLRKPPCDLNWLKTKIDELTVLAERQDAVGIKRKLKEILPEYEPYNPEEK
ncbi:MAG: nucleoside-diphosphate sugar epimerase/dehydratase [Thermodesulfobacteriota bacterium]